MLIIIPSVTERNIVAQTTTLAASGFPAPSSFEIRVLQNSQCFIYSL